MKKIIVVIGFILLANASFAQMAVVDATTNTNIATGNAKSAMFFSKSLAEAAKQFEKLKELKEKYEEQMKLVKVVNSVIANGKEMIKIKKNLSSITSEYSKGINYIKNEPTIDNVSKAKLMSGYSVKLSESLDYFVDASNFISDSYQMNDAERIKMLNETNEKLEFQKGFIIYLNNKIKYNVLVIKEKKGNAAFLTKEYKSINKNK